MVIHHLRLLEGCVGRKLRWIKKGNVRIGTHSALSSLKSYSSSDVEGIES